MNNIDHYDFIIVGALSAGVGVGSLLVFRYFNLNLTHQDNSLHIH
ncbi:hypothetical protein Bcell_4216 [Evansella cellulosilytica DSM 2522]|uniref:Uncharacterized protein n=1 Tax=Evansella cellulosilytica (strain ATCC 21833 / DSM 2522 / FERM P-1141 / JCM 9156 / N-4) TaxID=649639 RepID=E6TZ00_EVAC2|nr:hypothetical protein Bcell_4216 [Evansella cellulosilytica DSM 2522]